MIAAREKTAENTKNREKIENDENSEYSGINLIRVSCIQYSITF